MGKGDIKTKRGKIINKSFGKRRLKKISESYVQVIKPKPIEAIVEETVTPIKKAAKKTTTVKKPAAKKPSVAKKPV